MQIKDFNSLRQTMSSWSNDEKLQYFNSLNEKELRYLYKFPDLFLYDKQIIEGDDWRYYILRCGRSFGKTYSGSAWIAKKVIAGAKVIGLVGPTYKDVVDTMVKAIISWFPPGEAWYIGGEKQKIYFKNYPDTTIHCYSSDTEIRGPNLSYLWCDEVCKWCDSIPEKVQECFDLVDFAVRVGDSPQIIITSTPKPFPIFIEWEKKVQQFPQTYKLVTGTMFDNPTLPQSFIQSQIEKHGNTRLGRQELYGELLIDVEGALWTNKTLDQYRISPIEFRTLLLNKRLYINRTIIALDPAGSTSINSDETGIIVAHYCSDNHAYVVADQSGKYSPANWAKLAIKLYNDYQADLIVAEKNFGGDMVMSTIHSVDSNAPVKLVNASKGKIARMEPVAALYERGKVHHIGVFPELEQQLTHYTGNPKEKSPDRGDALAWAITELMLNKSYNNRDVSSIGNY